MSAIGVLEGLRAAKVIAVVRADGCREAIDIAEPLAAGDLQAIELTFATLGVDAALAEVRRRLGDKLLLGAGTIWEPTFSSPSPRRAGAFQHARHRTACGAGCDDLVRGCHRLEQRC